MCSFTRQWCCSSIRHKGKVCIHNTRHLPAVSWLFLSVRSMRWAALPPPSLFVVLDLLTTQFLVHIDQRWCPKRLTPDPVLLSSQLSYLGDRIGKWESTGCSLILSGTSEPVMNCLSPVGLLRSLSHFCCSPFAAIHVRVCGISWWIGSSVPVT